MGNNLLALLIMDGWGVRETSRDNAIKLADTPNYDKLVSSYSNIEINTSGEYVGLPDGLMGNSEVGHLNIGAGRIVYQGISRINHAIKENILKDQPEFVNFIKYVKDTGKQVHLMGLLSDGGVHTHINHLFAFLDILKSENIKKVYIHALLDGRDTPPTSGIKYVKQLQDYINKIGIGKIATIMGRYYAMDRDNRWERVQKAYDAMVFGKSDFKFSDPITAVQESYDNDITDEFMMPAIIVDEHNKLIAQVKQKDALLFFNYRGDRAREITRAFVDKNFDKFLVEKKLNVRYLCLMEYDETIDAPVLFPPVKLKNLLGEILANNKKRQLRIAETEKYAHVTFFFNGGNEEPFALEDRILIPSPKVATYDLKPEMSAYEVTDAVIEKINKEAYDVIILNFANPDMVGHTGIMPAAIKAIETIDTCLGRIVDAILAKNGTALITADHGNAEMMVDPVTNKPHTAHTTNKVPLICVDSKKQYSLKNDPDAKLADIAPTMLDILGISIPKEMTGSSLLVKR